MSFITELKRRNVFRIGAAYAVLGWLFIQILETILPVFSAPAWVLQTLIFLILLGLPGALILAWLFEITPEGVKTQHAADDAGEHSAGIKLNTIIITGLVLAVVFLLIEDNLPGGTETEEGRVAQTPAPVILDEITATATLEKSLAVLPFADLSPDSDQEYFSDGLSEELLNKLAQVDDLQVTARTSSFFYKGRNEDMRTIGEQLGVNYILEGSVRKAGDNVRITAQLIQADNGFHLWSQTYDRELADIFELQDEIATAVTQALSITLGAGEFDRPGMTRNVEAYDEFLKAALIFQEFTRASARLAISHIERAVQLDPEFYSAWALMDRVYAAALFVYPTDQTEEFVNRRAYARELLQSQAADHPLNREFGINNLMQEGSFAEAERQLLQLIADTGDNSSPYLANYAALLMTVGRNRDALPYFQAARRQDPLNVGIPVVMHRNLIALNRTGEARVEIERGLAIPNVTAQLALVLRRGYWHAALQEGDLDKAKAAWRDMEEPEPDTAMDYWLRGEYAQGLEVVRNAVSDENFQLIGLSAQAQFATVLGDHQLSLDLYRRGVGFSPGIIWLDNAAEMRKLPDFKLFMEELGIADYWRTTGNWADKCQPVDDTFECF